MIKDKKPYFVAEIAYDPCRTKMPWLVQRIGLVPEQGGPSFGMETLYFKKIEDAITYLKTTIKRDMNLFKEEINKKEKE